ncbi:hypothetical protein MTR67_051875 [Solanum verrucosum]|uniref:Uncharacterized protein n=1 Tax=Solanum verrucosum TaxID=315347 RepID=A0AAF1A2U0_SOLVR|nr:hypothetical protein MTR67_051875 [Solanum verrucosum]
MVSIENLALLQVGEFPLAMDTQFLASSFERLDISKYGRVLSYWRRDRPYWIRFGLNNLIMEICVVFETGCYKVKPKRKFLMVREFWDKLSYLCSSGRVATDLG